jgi:hypothetical protein
MLLDRRDQLVQVLVQPGVGKVVLVNVGDAEQPERLAGLGVAVGFRARAGLAAGEDDRANLRAARCQLGECRPASELEIVGVSPSAKTVKSLFISAALSSAV